MLTKMLWKIFPFFLFLFLISCQQGENKGPVASSPVGESEVAPPVAAPVEEAAPAEEEAVPQVVPGVVLRDDAKVWDHQDGVLSASPLASLDMGTTVVYLGVDQKLASGGNSYNYSQVKLADGTVGWISAVRLGKNAVPAVVVESSGLYKKPVAMAPVNRTVPAGQIVAVSLEKGNVNNFAEIRFSYYDGTKISNPETRYIPSNKLSASSNDMDAAKLVLKAFRNPELSADFYNLALSLGSVFEVNAGFSGAPRVYKKPDLSSESLTTADEIKLLAINPIEKGEALPWYLGQIGGNELVWVYADSVEIAPALGEKLTERPQLADNTTYRGNGVASVNLYPRLALRKKVRDDQGKESLIGYSSLEQGEVVYSTGEIFRFENIDFVFVEFPNGDGGWASASYIAQNAVPAVVTQDGIQVFKEPKLTALTTIRLNRYQVLAVHNDGVSGFSKVSYRSQEDDKTHREVYVKSNDIAVSYDEKDVQAALLLQKFLKAEKAEDKDFYLKKAAMIPSFLRDDLESLYYQDDASEAEASEETAAE